MVYNQEFIESEEDKNLSEYEEIWNEIRNKIKVTAKEYVEKLYKALINAKYTPEEAREKIKRDATNIWSEKTIDDCIPKEAKQEIRVLQGKLGQEIKKQKNQLRQSEANSNPNDKKESNSSSFSKPINEILNLKFKTKSQYSMGPIIKEYTIEVTVDIDLENKKLVNSAAEILSVVKK